MPIHGGILFEIDLEKCDSLGELFRAIGLTLKFEMVPSRSWDAFIDQFREFCCFQKTNTILKITHFDVFERSNPEIAAKLVGILMRRICEHRKIVDENKIIPEEERIHDNSDVMISLWIP